MMDDFTEVYHCYCTKQTIEICQKNGSGATTYWCGGQRRHAPLTLMSSTLRATCIRADDAVSNRASLQKIGVCAVSSASRLQRHGALCDII